MSGASKLPPAAETISLGKLPLAAQTVSLDPPDATLPPRAIVLRRKTWFTRVVAWMFRWLR